MIFFITILIFLTMLLSQLGLIVFGVLCGLFLTWAMMMAHASCQGRVSANLQRIIKLAVR